MEIRMTKKQIHHTCNMMQRDYQKKILYKNIFIRLSTDRYNYSQNKNEYRPQ